MTDDEHYTEMDIISDVIEDPTRPYSDSEDQIVEGIETEVDTNTVQDSELLDSEDLLITVEKKQQSVRSDVVRSTRLPIARIKSIMKMDPDVNMINSDAAFLVTKATEMFLETLAKETYTYTSMMKRKTIAKKDLDTTINMVDCLCFLEGALDY